MEILSLKKQCEWMDGNLETKLQMIPNMMNVNQIDMWIVFAKEYNEDPVLKYLTPSSFPTARRLTCLIFTNTSEGFKRFNCGMPSSELAPYYENIFKGKDEEQFPFILELIKKINPKTIGLNFSEYFAIADGISKQIFDRFTSSLPNDILGRIVSAEKLCINYLETRIQKEIDMYYSICELAMKIVEEGFSSKVITPGVTTNTDVMWWLKEKVHSLGMPFWFCPTVDIQRYGRLPIWDENEVIIQGDLLHVDFGLQYLGLCTDHQRLAYVPKDGETKVPEYLTNGLKINNHFQDKNVIYIHIEKYLIYFKNLFNIVNIIFKLFYKIVK